MTDQPDDPSSRILRKLSLAETITSAWNSTVKWGGLVAISYFVFRTVEALSGTTTFADIGLEVRAFANIKISQLAAWFFALCGVGYGLGQRRLRKDTIERLQSRIQRLETEIDPDRSTSSLTTRGETRPEDEL